MEGTSAPGGRRARRSTRVSRDLAEARRRKAAQLATQREQEKAVDAALREFYLAGDRIDAAEADFLRRVEPHRRAVERLRERRDERVAAGKDAQSLAALAIKEADRSAAQVGELLGLGEKAARRLIAAGRDARERTADAATEEDGREHPDRAGQRPAGNAEAAPTGEASAYSRGESWPASSPEPGAASA